MAKKETLLLRILASTRDAVRSFRSLDGVLTRLNANAAEAQDAVAGVGDGADESARSAEQAMRRLGLRSTQQAAKSRASWQAAFDAIERSSASSTTDILRARQELNRRLERLDREMALNFERRIDKMARAVRSLGRAGLVAGLQLSRMVATASIGGFTRLTSVVTTAASVVTRGVRTIVSGLTQIATASARLFSRSVIGGGAAAGAFAIQVGQVAGEFERIAVALKATTGEDYERASKFVEEYAKKVVFSQQEIAGSLLKLRNFGFSQADAETALPALIDQVSKLGGTYEDLDGIILAVGQAWAKQKLQGEEILQLVERGVPVWDLLAKVTGKSVTEIQKLSESGKLGRDVIRDLLVEIGKGASGAAAGQLNTYNGLVSQLTKAWSALLVEIGDSGVFDRLKNILRGLIDFLGRPETIGIFTRFAEVGVLALEKVSEGVQNLLLVFGGRAADTLERWITTSADLFAELLGVADKNFDGFVSAVEAGVSAFVEFARAATIALPYVLKLVTDIMSGISAAIAGVDENTIEVVVANIAGAVSKVAQGVADFFNAIDQGAIRAIVVEISAFINTLAGLFAQAASGQSGAALAQSLADGFTTAAGAIQILGRELTQLFNVGLTGGKFESGFFQAIQKFAVEDFPAIKSAFMVVVDFLNSIGVQGAVAAVGIGGFLSFLPGLVDFVDNLGGAATAIGTFVTWVQTLSVFSGLAAWFSTAGATIAAWGAAIAGFASTAGAAFLGFVSTAGAAIAGFFATAAAAIAAAPAALIAAIVVAIVAAGVAIYVWWDEIVALFKAGVGIVGDIFGTLFDGLLGGFSNIWEGIKSGWNATIDFLAGLIPDWVKNLFGGDATVTVNGDGTASTGQFWSGGYTGSGGKYDPAGTVHKGEYVFDQMATRRIGVPALEALRNGIMPRSLLDMASPMAPAAVSAGGRRVGFDVNIPGVGSISGDGDPADLRRLRNALRHQKAKTTAPRPRGSI